MVVGLTQDLRIGQDISISYTLLLVRQFGVVGNERKYRAFISI
jgi:hypothetical protein